jgi:hypothetical protein
VAADGTKKHRRRRRDPSPRGIGLQKHAASIHDKILTSHPTIPTSTYLWVAEAFSTKATGGTIHEAQDEEDKASVVRASAWCKCLVF